MKETGYHLGHLATKMNSVRLDGVNRGPAPASARKIVNALRVCFATQEDAQLHAYRMYSVIHGGPIA